MAEVGMSACNLLASIKRSLLGVGWVKGSGLWSLGPRDSGFGV